MERLRFAVIGCGAAAELNRLPALASSDRVAVTCLVDPVISRAQALASRFGVPEVAEDYRAIANRIDAAVLTLPNHLHARTAVDLLDAGVHVLVEKPMALTVAECEQMAQTAERTGAVLAVGLEFRFFPPARFVKEAIAGAMLGNITGFDVRQGLVLAWPLQSDYLLRRETAGGGVLIDFGVHIVDLLLWWLGDVVAVDYQDDSLGGVEAECEMRLTFASGATGQVSFSRIRKLRNTAVLRGERATLEVELWNPDGAVWLTPGAGPPLAGRVPGVDGQETWAGVFRRQLDDFVDAILEPRPPLVSGREGIRSIALVETCYRSRQPLEQPWMLVRETEYTRQR
jgi:predicted dehydrogenase